MKTKLLVCLISCTTYLVSGQTLQQVTDNGATTNKSITTGNVTIQGTSLSGPNVPSNIDVLNGVRINGNIPNSSHNGITYQSSGGGGAAIGFYREGSYETGLDFYTNAANVAGNIQNRMRIASNGYVGIGTLKPSSALQIGDMSNNNQSKQILIPGVYNFERLTLGQIGNGGAALEFVNHSNPNNAYGMRIMSNLDDGGQGLQFQYALNTTSYSALTYQTGMFMDLHGQIGIGTVLPKEKLSVNGNIRAKEIKVETNNWPDYVFGKNYKLVPLAEVGAFIDKHHHLPEVPTAQQVVNEGLNLGEMNKVLVKKVEELTLYLLEKDKHDRELQSQVDVLKKQVEALLNLHEK